MNGYLYQVNKFWDEFDGTPEYGKLTTKELATVEARESLIENKGYPETVITVYQIKNGIEKRSRGIFLEVTDEIQAIIDQREAEQRRIEEEKENKLKQEREERILNNNPQTLSEIFEHISRFGFLGNNNTNNKGNE